MTSNQKLLKQLRDEISQSIDGYQIFDGKPVITIDHVIEIINRYADVTYSVTNTT